MAGLLDFFSGGDSATPGGLLEFLRANAQNQQPLPGGLLSDVANYGPSPSAPLSMAGPAPAMQPTAANQPSPLDTAQWPVGPVGAPSNANAAMPAPQPPAAVPFSMAGPRPAPPAPIAAQAAPAAPIAAPAPDNSPGIGDRLALGAKGFLGNMAAGPVGALLGGLGAAVSGLPTDPGTIEAQRVAKSQTANEQFLQAKGVDPASIAAARSDPELMKRVVSQVIAAQAGDRDFAFRQDEAKRAQSNADRTYSLAERTAARADEGPVDKATQRGQAAEKFGLVPGSDGYKSYVLTGKLPEADATVVNQVAQRQAAAAAIGLKPDHPAYQSYLLTGKMPREDAQPLTATDKKAVLEADEKVQAGRSTIDNLRKAKTLSTQAFAGPYAGKIGYAASFLGDSSDTGKAGIATQDLENLVTSNALQQLRTIFGGNPTEGERGILLDIQGSVGKPDAVRQKIYDRAIEAANKRLAFEQQRADELRGGTFYKPPAAKTAPAAPAAAAEATAAPGGNVTKNGINWSVAP